jgi:hypothetical protein
MPQPNAVCVDHVCLAVIGDLAKCSDLGNPAALDLR